MSHRDDVEPADVADKLRKSNDEARARGKRFLDFGNALFREQRFHEALQRYKSAIEAAPDLTEAYVREGFALIAVNQYRLATKALKIALELDPEYVRSQFRLDDLYGDNRLAKTSHLELLAREALENPGDGDLLFLVGMSLYADGEVDRASRFFAKAAELGGAEAVRLLTPVLGKAAPPEVVPAAPDKKDPASTSECILRLTASVWLRGVTPRLSVSSTGPTTASICSRRFLSNKCGLASSARCRENVLASCGSAT